MSQNNYFNINKRQIVSKWSPIVEQQSGIINKEIITIVSLYCEWLSMSIDNGDILEKIESERFEKIQDKNESEILLTLLFECITAIKNKSPKLKIVNKWFNPLTERVEMELENGEFVCEGSTGLKISDYFDCFPIKFLSNIYPNLVRDNQINTIFIEDGGIN